MPEEDRVQAMLYCFLIALSRGRDTQVAYFTDVITREPAFQSTTVARWLINAIVQNKLVLPDVLLSWLYRYSRSQVIVDLLIFFSDRVFEVGK